MPNFTLLYNNDHNQSSFVNIIKPFCRKKLKVNFEQKFCIIHNGNKTRHSNSLIFDAKKRKRL